MYPDDVTTSEGSHNHVDLAPSSVYPSLERSPGKRDNWVEATGGLPKYIERIAKRLHYEQGMTISHAIATAVNTVKRWARGGNVAKGNAKTQVNKDTQAKAILALAQWESKKARARALSVEGDLDAIDLATYNLDRIRDEWQSHERDRRTPPSPTSASEPERDYRHVAEVWNTHLIVKADSGEIVKIPYTVDEDGKPSFGSEVKVRQDYVELAISPSVPDYESIIDLAPKWKHGFVPANAEAKRIKAKQSDIAMKRMNRLYGNVQQQNAHSEALKQRFYKQRKGKPVPKGLRVSKSGRATERTSTGRVATSRRAITPDSTASQRIALQTRQKEHSKGGGISPRARKAWNEIPEAQKVTRNGKRYVVTTYQGKSQLTEWIGNRPAQDPNDIASRRLSSITLMDASKMTTAQLQRALKVAGQPEHVMKVLNKALRTKRKAGVTE